jgi:uncharacterized protein
VSDSSLLPILSCERCGACCREVGLPPFTGLDGDEPPRWLEWDADYHIDRQDRRLPCLWYDAATGRCRHYEYRPEACREFEMGSADCLEHRRQWRIDA